MTTRKTAIIFAVAALALGGCATPGPLHVYSLPSVAAPAVSDAGGPATAEVPSFLVADDTLTGFAYDPFTDHFFLRLAPGNVIRVVDRPARAIKREFTVDAMPATGGGDLAAKPRDGHLFLLHPTEAAVIELTRLGKFLRTFPLAGTPAPAAGIAYDAARDELLVLGRGPRPAVAIHDVRGARLGGFTLDRAVTGSLAFDSEKRELYAPLAPDGAQLGVFDETGRLVRPLELPAAFVDVGPRSFIRVF